MDSLSAANFTAYLTPLWKLVQDTELPRNIVYKYSSIDSLHQVITGRISHVMHRNNAENIDAIIKKWTFPNVAPANRSSYLEPMSSDIDDGRVTVLLTGSTGAFGSHVLSQLVQREGVYAVYCLDRANPRSLGARTQRIRREAASDKGDTKVEFWSMELGKTDLGLDSGTVQKVSFSNLGKSSTDKFHRISDSKRRYPCRSLRMGREFQPRVGTFSRPPHSCPTHDA
jgi:hypothetical protein